MQSEPAAQKQFPCQQCGAKLDFAPGTARLKCSYCGFENPIPQSEEQIEDLDFRTFLAKAADEHETHEALRVKCEKCAAETTMPVDAASGLCPFCGANQVFAGKSSRLIKPKSLLPFKATQKQAFDDFRKWINRLWFAPGDLKRYAQSEGKLAGVYVPFWTYNADATSFYRGERGHHYYVTETYTTEENGRTVTRERQVQRTRWTPASGTVWNSFKDLLILASKSLPKKYTDRLEPWDLENLVPYADDYLSGFRAESYQVDLGDGFQEAQKVMDAGIRESIREDIGGDEQRIHSVKTQYGKITFKHLLLPVWLSAYRFRDKIFRILINARTGEVQGERPYSPWKIAGAVAAVLIIVAIIVALASLKQ
jgi:hypothetical protein